MNKFAKFLLDESKQDKMIPFLSVLLGFVIGAIIMLASGYNPIEAYKKLLEGAGILGKDGIGLFTNLKRLGDTLLSTTTLILTGLSVAFAFRTGLFNIGASGQMLMGGFVAVFLGLKLDFPKYIQLPILVIAAIVVGSIWAMIPAILKAKYKIHEVVTCIMMNWIALWSVYYFVPTYIKGQYDTESKVIPVNSSLRMDWISDLFKHSSVNLGLILALIAAILIWWVLEKTTFGYELKAVGFNKDAAKYAGMKVNRNIILSMMIAGALAGLAGATYYLGYTDNVKIGILPDQGFDGIAVSLLGLNSPIGVIASAFLFGFMNAGKGFMQSSTNVPNELVPIITGIIIFFAATNLMIKAWLKSTGRTLSKKSGGAK